MRRLLLALALAACSSPEGLVPQVDTELHLEGYVAQVRGGGCLPGGDGRFTTDLILFAGGEAQHGARPALACGWSEGPVVWCLGASYADGPPTIYWTDLLTWDVPAEKFTWELDGLPVFWCEIEWKIDFVDQEIR